MANYVLIIDLGGAAAAMQYQALTRLMRVCGFTPRRSDLRPAQFSLTSALPLRVLKQTAEARIKAELQANIFADAYEIKQLLQFGATRPGLSKFSLNQLMSLVAFVIHMVSRLTLVKVGFCGGQQRRQSGHTVCDPYVLTRRCSSWRRGSVYYFVQFVSNGDSRAEKLSIHAYALWSSNSDQLPTISSINRAARLSSDLTKIRCSPWISVLRGNDDVEATHPIL